MSTKGCQMLTSILNMIYRGLALAGILSVFITSNAIISSAFIISGFSVYLLSRYATALFCKAHQQELEPSIREWYADLPHEVEHEYLPTPISQEEDENESLAPYRNNVRRFPPVKPTNPFPSQEQSTEKVVVGQQ